MPSSTIQNVPEWAKVYVARYAHRAYYLSDETAANPYVFISPGSGGELLEAIVVEGRVDYINIISGGTGFSDVVPPILTVVAVDGTGYGATASCTVVDGIIATVTVDTTGADYQVPPNVVIQAPGSGATAHTHLTGGAVTSIDVDSGGSGYQVAPLVQILGGLGTGATAHAHITGDNVTSIDVDTGGSGYNAAPVLFTAYGGTIIAPQNANELAGIAALATRGVGNTTITNAYDFADGLITEDGLAGMPVALTNKINTKGAAAFVTARALIGKKSNYLDSATALAQTLTASTGATFLARLLAELEDKNYRSERASMDSALGVGVELAKQAVTDAESLRKAGLFAREYLQYTYELTHKLFIEGEEIGVFKLEIFGNALRMLTGSMQTSTQDVNSASGLMQAVGVAATATGIYSALNQAGLFTVGTASAAEIASSAAAFAAAEAGTDVIGGIIAAAGAAAI